MKRILLFILTLGILVALYVWFFVYNKSHRDIHSEEVFFDGTTTELVRKFHKADGSIDSAFIDQVVIVRGALTEREDRSYILDEKVIVHLDTVVKHHPDTSHYRIKGRLHGISDDIIYGTLINIDHGRHYD